MALSHKNTPKVVLITGAARRIGAAIARILHAKNYNIIIHYYSSFDQAQALHDELNTIRPESAALLQADLIQTAAAQQLIAKAQQIWQRLDVLINNASSFYATPLDTATEEHWEDLIGSNLKAPFFLAQAAAPWLAQQHGCIINIADIHAQKPLKSYPIYSIAKAGLVMLTQSLARELAPHVRVNAVAPGAILWPEKVNHLDEVVQQKIISRTALKRSGNPQDIAQAILFFIKHANFVTGQVLAVDGGRLLD